MATSWSFLLYSTSLFLSLLCLSSLAISDPSRSSDPINGSSPDIHDVLPTYNIPRGIVPNGVKSYSLSEDGSFVVYMEHPCYVKFEDDQLVYYDKVIKGKLSYGRITQVSGIQAKRLFIWVSVTGLDIDTGSDMVDFHVGFISQKLPAKQFETIPTCMNKAACSESVGHGNGFGSALKMKSFWVNYY